MPPFVAQQDLDIAVQTLQKRINAVATGSATVHNSLTGLQGGQSGQYYHLNSAAYGYLSAQDQYVKTTSSPQFAGLTVLMSQHASTQIIVSNPDTTTSDYETQAMFELQVAGVVVGSLKTTAKSLYTGATVPALYLTTFGNYDIAFGFNNNLPSHVFKNDGKVGIGTTSPGANLHIDNPGGAVIYVTRLGSSANRYMISTDGADMSIGPLDAGRLILLSGAGVSTVWIESGCVGIGTIVPQSPLEIRSATNARLTINRVGGWATSPCDIKFNTDDAGTGVWTLGMVADASNHFRLKLNTFEYLTVLDSGNVGIGAVSPASKLSVSGVGTIGGVNGFGVVYTVTENILSTNTEVLDWGPSLGFGSSGKYVGAPTNPYLYAIIRGAKESPTLTNDYAGYLAFYTIDASSATAERMRVTSTGNVGIGTATPGSKLEVKDSFFRVNRPAAANDVDAACFYSEIGTDVTLGPLYFSIITHPTSSAATRYCYISVGDSQGYRSLILQPVGGNVGIGESEFGTNANKVLAVSTGIAPASSPADSFQMYSADFAAGNACPTFRTENGTIIQLYSDPSKYVQSRLENLITNGTGLLGNNTNFSDWIFDAVECYAGGGSFLTAVIQNARFTDEYLPVDPSLHYRIMAWAKAGDDDGYNYNPTNKQYFGFAEYDIDFLPIQPEMVTQYTGATDTSLAEDLENGDTQIVLTDAYGWCNTSPYYSRWMAWWPYQNQKGGTYLDYTYTRNVAYGPSTQGLWPVGGISGNVITLNETWSGGTLPAGTKVRNANSGSGYKYNVLQNYTIPNIWTHVEGYMGGWMATGEDSANKFRFGTAYIKLLWLPNYDAGANHIRYSGIQLTNLSANNLEVAGATTIGVVTTGAQTFAGSKTFSSQIVSSVATGTAPLSIASITVCINLNADLLDGQHASAFAPAAHVLLSATHTDTVSASPVQGDMIYANATPNWTKLAKGTTADYLKGGDTPSWATLNQAAVAGLTTASSPAFAGLTIGSLGGILIGTAGVVSAITNGSANWNTAYGWGDHASAGYALTTRKLDDFGTPDDNTDLDATATHHGLLLRLDNVATHYLNGQGGWGIPSGTDPGGMAMKVGTAITISNNTERTTASNTPVKKKEIKINETVNGTLTIDWQMKTGSAGVGAYTRVYLNGYPYGDEESSTSSTYSSKTCIISGLIENDLIQIYCNADNPAVCYVRNMTLKYSWEITTIGAHTLTTPIAVTDTRVISNTVQDP